jgi:hypothetical protein
MESPSVQIKLSEKSLSVIKALLAEVPYKVAAPILAEIARGTEPGQLG